MLRALRAIEEWLGPARIARARSILTVSMLFLSIASACTTVIGLWEYAVPPVAISAAFGLQIFLFWSSQRLATSSRSVFQNTPLFFAYLLALFTSAAFSSFALYRFIETPSQYEDRAENAIKAIWIENYNTIVQGQKFSAASLVASVTGDSRYRDWFKSYTEAMTFVDGQLRFFSAAVESGANEARTRSRSKLQDKLGEQGSALEKEQDNNDRIKKELTTAETKIGLLRGRLTGSSQTDNSSRSALEKDRDQVRRLLETQTAKVLQLDQDLRREETDGGTVIIDPVTQKPRLGPSGQPVRTVGGKGEVWRGIARDLSDAKAAVETSKRALAEIEKRIVDYDNGVRGSEDRQFSVRLEISQLEAEISNLKRQESSSSAAVERLRAELQTAQTAAKSDQTVQVLANELLTPELARFVSTVNSLGASMKNMPRPESFASEYRGGPAVEGQSRGNSGDFVDRVEVATQLCPKVLYDWDTLSRLGKSASLVTPTEDRDILDLSRRCGPFGMDRELQLLRYRSEALEKFAGDCTQGQLFRDNGAGPEPYSSKFDRWSKALGRCLGAIPFARPQERRSFVEKVFRGLNSYHPESHSHQKVITALASGQTTALVAVAIAFVIDTLVLLSALAIRGRRRDEFAVLDELGVIREDNAAVLRGLARSTLGNRFLDALAHALETAHGRHGETQHYVALSSTFYKEHKRPLLFLATAGMAMVLDDRLVFSDHFIEVAFGVG